MNFEDFQKSWQSQNAGAKVTIDADVLLKEVRRNQQQFWATIFCRDVREVGVCALMTVFFLTWGILWHWWSLDLLAFCCLEVGVFFVVDRRVQRRKQPVKNETLQSCIENSLFQVNHQIWLLKNIFWWYLLPILIGVGAVAGSVVWNQRDEGLAAMIGAGTVYVVVYGLVYWGVYWLNQFAVRKDLEPRRCELESLLANLAQ
jgi:hypothetical protein